MSRLSRSVVSRMNTNNLASINLKLLKMMLEMNPFGSVSITLAHNGEEAVDLTSTMQFDMVVMDVHMPRSKLCIQRSAHFLIDIAVNGMQATKKIRAIELIPTKIVALSADVMSTTYNECIKAGMDSFLTKPIDREKLNELLHLYCFS